MTSLAQISAGTPNILQRIL